ncbi:unnamed protein product [Darwinula stevensoni]|uniref:Aromatic amino acid beta-eliminating lyase/threonine aldolase domain-containing protein n=1 Tax=Darwinula stevensoni TaxID=69355 RepID=A0A7R9A3N9_9CRUS|nr:unnamed protein product [Darwinula stevensoni]CAG0891010.1 unnamed protein product [Darwinula stevensoni]
MLLSRSLCTGRLLPACSLGSARLRSIPSASRSVSTEAAGDMGPKVIDLRSDTVTRPGPEMRKAMFDAHVGDDVFRDDPTVLQLEKKTATLTGMEAALFVPSGTMGNLICIMTHCWGRGSEIFVGDQSHIFLWEQGGSAQVAGVHPHPLRNNPDGTFSTEELRRKVREDDPHCPITSLVCIENTHNMCGGRSLPIPWIDEVVTVAGTLGIPVHVDGARLLNAAVKEGVPPARLLRGCSSVSLCLSKGLGAPIGSLIAGSHSFIQRALRVRKLLGGGMRQVGILAAAGIYALDHQFRRLEEDHSRARYLAQKIAEIAHPMVGVDVDGVHTNIVLLRLNTEVGGEEGISVLMGPMGDDVVRFVLHCDVRAEDVDLAASKFETVIKAIPWEIPSSSGRETKGREP